MTRLLARSGLRYLRRHPAQGWLALLGIALGVAVVIAVDLAVGSADQAFRLSAQALTGRANYQIVGGPDGLDENLFARVRIEGGLRDNAPRVEGFGRLTEHDDATVRLLGIDPLSDGEVRDVSGIAADGSLRRLLIEPDTALITRRTADHLHLAEGDGLQVLSHGRLRTLTVAGVVTPAQAVAAEGLDEVLILDIATAQEVLAMTGRLSRIDLRLPQGPAGEAAQARIRALLPPGAALVASETLNANLDRMTGAFRLNLHAMSLLGLVVGMFLIYNAVSFSVVQRRPLWASLRALGVTRREIFTVVMQEAALMAAAGTAIGIALGDLLGHGLVQVVLRTINDLYFTVAMSDPPTPAGAWIKGVVLGTAASLAAAALPAWQAASLPVSQVLRRIVHERRMRRQVPGMALLGVALLVAGIAMLTLSRANLATDFAALFLAVVGYALLTPLGTRILMTLLHTVLPRRALMTRMAARGVIVSLSRTGVAVAALAVVISVSLGMALMIGSFRHTLSAWLDQTLQADIYVSAAGPGGVLSLDTVAALRALPDVSAVSTGRRWQLDGPGGITELFALDPAPRSFRGFRFKAGDADAIWPAFLHRDAVLVSEPYAMHHRLHVNDTLSLRTDRGPHAFTVAGIYYDYGSDQGVVTMSRATYARWWQDRSVTTVGLYLAPGADGNAVAEELQRFDGDQALSIRPSRVVYQGAMTIFERTFAITRVLQVVALIVAAVGIVSALAALQLDRGRELGVLRSLGLTRGQLWALVAGESLLMGLAAGLFALPLGLGLAWVLINVIQAQAFGWTMALHVDARELLRVMLLAMLAATAAACYPAWRMARLPPLAVLREE